MLKLCLLLFVSAHLALAEQDPSYSAYVDPPYDNTPRQYDNTPPQYHNTPPQYDNTPPPPPRPYVFSYSAGRFPGHADRSHTEVSDGSGVVKGTFSYVDPRNVVRTVDYTADRDGFHPVLSHPQALLPTDSEAVAKEKEKHLSLYARIAEQHATNPHPGAGPPALLPVQSEAVAKATNRHYDLFSRIAEQHHQIGVQREAERQAFEATSEQNINELHQY